jgi:hypothetical protein
LNLQGQAATAINRDTRCKVTLGHCADERIGLYAMRKASGASLFRGELLGYKSKLKWTRASSGLQIQMPVAPPGKYAYSFRILPA